MSDLTDVLRDAGVERVYCAVEAGVTPIAEAISRDNGITWIEMRNDEAAALAAAYDAQASGRLAVCAGSIGAGKTQLARGLHNAHRSGAPVLAVASHISTAQTGNALVHELRPERLFAECSHYCGVASDPSEMSWLARTAMQHALVRGGVAVLLLDPPFAVSPPDISEQSASGSICGRIILRQPPVRVRGLTLNAGCAVRRHPRQRR
jgi:pyruvate dehydrogenase (quinone)